MEIVNTKKHRVHKVLAQSYSVYLILFLFGIWLDVIFDFEFFPDTFIMPVGLLLLVFASILILSAQKIGHEFRKIKEKRTEHFHHGPYHYTRIPTQWGLFFLMLGFGMVTNSFFVIMFSVLAFAVAKFVFIGKQEKILEEKYGTHYTEYKRSVKF